MLDTKRVKHQYTPSPPFTDPVARLFELKQRHDAHKTQGELAVLQEANVVGMTTTGVAMNQALVEALGARIVVVEEAAEVTRRLGFNR